MSDNQYQYMKFLYEKEYSPKNNTLDFPTNDFNSKIYQTQVQDDIFLMKSNINIEKKTIIKTDSNIEGILLNFVFQGNNEYKSLITDYSIKSKENFTSMSLINNEKGIESFNENSLLKSINIVVKKDFLFKNLPQNKISESIFKNLENKNCNFLLKNRPTNHKAKLITSEIYSSNYFGNLEKLFLDSKVLELLYIEFNDLCQNPSLFKKEKIKFSNYDVAALHHARSILLENMQNPPSIQNLAKIVKLNEFKLKIGFKKLFDTTPYKYLHEYKMQKAKILLETSDMNVTEIANEIGYKFLHNFSKVFAQRFGILPKDLMKSRKYYY